MKRQIALTTAMAALLPVAAFAQTSSPSTAAPVAQPNVQPAPPAAPAPPVPPAPPGQPHHEHMHDEDMPQGPVTFLGVETSHVPRVLSEQLGLPRGFGVVVDYVVPNSAAATAGLQQSDVIRLLNDQIILEPDQLGKLIRSYSDGTTVTLTILRKGQEMKLPVKLSTKKPREEHGPYGFEHEWKFDDLDNFDFDFHAPDMTAVREAVERAKKEARRAGDEARRAVQKLRVVTTDDDTTRSTKIDLGRAKIVFSDDRGELTIERINGKKTLTAKDAKGNVMFNGPIDTDEERAKVPAEVRERFEKLEDQDLPALPTPPEAPEPPSNNDSAQLQSVKAEPACLVPARHTGWVRNTMLL